MPLRTAILTGFQEDSLQMTFLVVSFMIPQILVAGLVHMEPEKVVNLVQSLVRQLMFRFVVKIVILPYSAIMM